MTNQVMSVEEIIRETFYLPEDTEIQDNDNPNTLDGWDSLGQINLLNNLEETFNIAIQPDETEVLLTVGDIKKLMKAKGIEL